MGGVKTGAIVPVGIVAAPVVDCTTGSEQGANHHRESRVIEFGTRFVRRVLDQYLNLR
jgi:hypothetical protein